MDTDGYYLNNLISKVLLSVFQAAFGYIIFWYIMYIRESFVEIDLTVHIDYMLIIFFLVLMLSIPGGRLNKKDGLTRYGNSHVKDKTS